MATELQAQPHLPAETASGERILYSRRRSVLNREWPSGRAFMPSWGQSAILGSDGRKTLTRRRAACPAHPFQGATAGRIDPMKTVRQEMIEELAKGEQTALGLSKSLRRSEKDIYEHLEHISRSLTSQGKRLTIVPARCLECGYLFESRNRFTSPGRCPRCKGTHIEDPRYRIE